MQSGASAHPDATNFRAVVAAVARVLIKARHASLHDQLLHHLVDPRSDQLGMPVHEMKYRGGRRDEQDGTLATFATKIALHGEEGGYEAT